MLSRILTKAFV